MNTIGVPCMCSDEDFEKALSGLVSTHGTRRYSYISLDRSPEDTWAGNVIYKWDETAWMSFMFREQGSALRTRIYRRAGTC